MSAKHNTPSTLLATARSNTDTTPGSLQKLGSAADALAPVPCSQVKELLLRNRSCLDTLIDTLFEQERLEGDEVRSIVEQHAHVEDLKFRDTAKEVAFM
jgi:hypothetical protein